MEKVHGQRQWTIPYSGKFSRMREIEHFANQCYCPYLCQQKTRHSRIIFSWIACNSRKFSPAKISRYTVEPTKWGVCTDCVLIGVVTSIDSLKPLYSITCINYLSGFLALYQSQRTYQPLSAYSEAWSCCHMSECTTTNNSGRIKNLDLRPHR